MRIAGSSDDLDRFMELCALLESKGYSDGAALQVAEDMVTGRQPQATMTRRFAGTRGLPLVREL